MSTRVIPASPNWYCSRVIDSNESKLIVYGARNCVYIYNYEEYPPAYLGVYTGHREKITTLSLCHNEDYSSLCCSASEEGAVKVWDTNDKSTKCEHSIHSVSAVYLDLHRKPVISPTAKYHCFYTRFTLKNSLFNIPTLFKILT